MICLSTPQRTQRPLLPPETAPPSLLLLQAVPCWLQARVFSRNSGICALGRCHHCQLRVGAVELHVAAHELPRRQRCHQRQLTCQHSACRQKERVRNARTDAEESGLVGCFSRGSPFCFCMKASFTMRMIVCPATAQHSQARSTHSRSFNTHDQHTQADTDHADAGGLHTK